MQQPLANRVAELVRVPKPAEVSQLLLRRIGALLLLLLLLAGCSRGPAPAEVAGSVSFDNMPVEEGTIRFFPAGQEMGHGAATNIVGGKYSIALHDGLVAGPYVVALTAVRQTGRQIPRREVDPGESPTIVETEQILPERYTIPGEMTAELQAGSNVQDFALTP